MRTGQAQIGERFMSALGKEDPLLEIDSQPFLATSYDDAMKLYKASKDEIVKLLDETGLVFFTGAIITGAVWAKPVWNTWWVWDANGTLTFVLWMIFIGYLMVRAYAPSIEIGRKWGAAVSILGAATVPFVYMAADWWGGLHPERVTGPGADGSLERSMLFIMLFSFTCFLLLFAYLLIERYKQRQIEDTIVRINQIYL